MESKGAAGIIQLAVPLVISQSSQSYFCYVNTYLWSRSFHSRAGWRCCCRAACLCGGSGPSLPGFPSALCQSWWGVSTRSHVLAAHERDLAKGSRSSCTYTASPWQHNAKSELREKLGGRKNVALYRWEVLCKEYTAMLLCCSEWGALIISKVLIKPGCELQLINSPLMIRVHSEPTMDSYQLHPRYRCFSMNACYYITVKMRL